MPLLKAEFDVVFNKTVKLHYEALISKLPSKETAQLVEMTVLVGVMRCRGNLIMVTNPLEMLLICTRQCSISVRANDILFRLVFIASPSVHRYWSPLCQCITLYQRR